MKKSAFAAIRLLKQSSPVMIVPFFFVLCPQPAHGAPDATSPVEQREISDATILYGIDLLYDRRFDDAEHLFRTVVAQDPERPVGYFYLAMVSWSRLAGGFWSDEVVREFHRRIDEAADVARKRIEEAKQPRSFDYFYLGGALGFKARFKLMRSEWLSSFFLASDAVEALKTCLQTDPNNKDVLFGLGVFDYYTARLSGVLKFLTYLLLHKGDKEEGLRKLHTAAEEARFSSLEAKSMLLHIYLFLEEDFEKALKLVSELFTTYSRNPRFAVLRGVCLIRIGRMDEYRGTLEEIRKRTRAAVSTQAADAWERRVAYLESIRALYEARYEAARRNLEAILRFSDAENDPTMVAWPLVKLGMSYHLEGNKNAARKYYDKVLGMENGAGAQFLAQRLLEEDPAKDDAFIGY